MDDQYEDSLRNNLLLAWNKGRGNAAEAELRAKILSHRMRSDESVARFHLSAIKDVAQGPLHVPTTHMILHDCYRRGWAVAADPVKALRHLELAIESGSESARWFLGCYLLGDERLASVLVIDPDRAMDIFRDLARNSKDITTMSLALRSAASYIARNFSIRDVSDEDRELVDSHALDSREIMGMDYLHLALFYAGEAASKDFAGPAYRQSRELLIAGSESRSEQVRSACEAQLDAWGVRPAPEPVMTPSQKAGQALKVTGMLGGVAAILTVWSLIGLFLLSVAATINAFMIPIILVVLAVGLVFSLLRRG